MLAKKEDGTPPGDCTANEKAARADRLSYANPRGSKEERGGRNGSRIEDYPSIAMVFFSSISGSVFFGTSMASTPLSNLALMSSCLMSSPM